MEDLDTEERAPSLEARIRKNYGLLPESERRVADLILDFPGEIAAYSATELAELAGSSKAAVTRFVRRLGFKKFEEARKVSRDGRVWGSPVYLMRKKTLSDSFGKQVTRHIDQDLKTIKRTFDGIKEDEFSAIVDRICSVKRIWLLGYRNSYYLAGYLRWQLIQVRGDVHLIPGSGETLAEHISDITPEDLLIIVGLRRRIIKIREVLKWAKKKNIPSLLITDPTLSAGNLANWTIHCEIRGEEIFDRYASVISLFHFLSMGAVVKSGDRGRNRLAKIEELHDGFRQF